MVGILRLKTVWFPFFRPRKHLSPLKDEKINLTSLNFILNKPFLLFRTKNFPDEPLFSLSMFRISSYHTQSQTLGRKLTPIEQNLLSDVHVTHYEVVIIIAVTVVDIDIVDVIFFCHEELESDLVILQAIIFGQLGILGIAII